MGNCYWPGCSKDAPKDKAFCYRHFSRLPAKNRGWLTGSFTGPDGDMQAVWAAVNFARKNPDPELPPFAEGEEIQGKPGTVFGQCVYLVDTCCLNDQKKWVVITTEGETLLASEFRSVQKV